MRALKWLVCCKRPLRLSELVVAIAIVPGSTNFDEERLLDNDLMLLEILGSLIRVNRDTLIVDLAHFSVVEYLTSLSLPDGSPNPYFIDVRETHGELLETCLTYICFPESETVLQSDASGHPFLWYYATKRWPGHGSEVDSIPHYRDLMLSFFQKSPVYPRWSRHWKQTYPREWLPAQRSLTTLYYAALFRLPHVVVVLIDAPEHWDKNIKGDALVAATQARSIEIVTKLLAAGANVRARTKNGNTALHLAVNFEDTDIARLLIDNQADVTLRGEADWTPLHMAGWLGDVDAGKLLLTAGADATAQATDRHYTPLHLAAWYQKKNMVILLLIHIRAQYTLDIKTTLADGTKEKSGIVHSTSAEMENTVQQISKLLYRNVDLVDEFSNVLRMYSRLLEIFPTDHVLHEFAGDAFFEKKNYREAFDAYHAGLFLNPENRNISSIEELTHSDYCYSCWGGEYTRLTGYRYRCTTCPDFDLCETCFNSEPFPHEKHSFICIPSKEWVSQKLHKS